MKTVIENLQTIKNELLLIVESAVFVKFDSSSDCDKNYKGNYLVTKEDIELLRAICK